jgi:hypothetical protein
MILISMTETTQLISTIKKLLKSQGVTYRDVAKSLKISEPSVKRMLASGRFTVDRLIQVSNMLGYTLAELSKEAQVGQLRLSTLTEQQEREVVSDTKLFLITVCTLNHWTMAEIVEAYRVTDVECIKYLLHLDRLRIIDLLPGNRIRINVARDFNWLPHGPIKQYFKNHGQGDFMNSQFDQENEVLAFVNGMFTDHAQAQILADLRLLRKKIAELHVESLTAPLDKRNGFGLLLATREWEPIEFKKLHR